MSNIILLTQTCTNWRFHHHQKEHTLLYLCWPVWTSVITHCSSVQLCLHVLCLLCVMLTQTVRLLSLSGTGEERLQNARKWEYVLFFFFFIPVTFFIWSRHSNWCVSLFYPHITHSLMFAHSEFTTHIKHLWLFTYKEIHIFSVTEFCVNISFTHFPFHPHHPRHKQTSVSIRLTIHSNGCPWQHQ